MTESPAEVEAPPGVVAGSWHEAYAEIAAAALEVRRLGEGDIDAARITGKVPAACAEIDQYLELRPVDGRVQYVVGGVTVIAYAPGDVPAPVLEAAVQLTLELYDRKDARFGVLAGASSSFGEPVRVSRDRLAGVTSLLDPWREGWGIG